MPGVGVKVWGQRRITYAVRKNRAAMYVEEAVESVGLISVRRFAVSTIIKCFSSC